MSLDCFEFWCIDCGSHIERLEFHSRDPVGVRLNATCLRCGNETVFKIKINLPLAPNSKVKAKASW